jgi:hypothetical protein
LYRSKVAALAEALDAPDMRERVKAAICGLIAEIRLVPVDGILKIELYGELASLLAFAASNESGSHTPGGALRGCK